MKTIRFIIVNLTIALFVGLSLIGCDDKPQVQANSQYTNSKSPTKEDINQEVKDSLYNFNSKIEAISKETKMTVASVSTMKTSVLQLQDRTIWLWISIGFGVTSLILCVICFKKCAYLQSRANRQSEELQELKREQQVNSYRPKADAKPSVPLDYELLKSRVCNLETQIRQLNSYSRPAQQSQVPHAVVAVNEEAPYRNGYFGNPIQAIEPYFKKLLVSQDSEARFYVEISGDKAVFKPLESSSYLGTFVSNDAMRSAIEFSGCTASDATSMQVIKPGEAMQKDNRWFIIKKSQVYLSC